MVFVLALTISLRLENTASLENPNNVLLGKITPADKKLEGTLPKTLIVTSSPPIQPSELPQVPELMQNQTKIVKPENITEVPVFVASIKVAANPNFVFSRLENRECSIVAVVKKTDGTPVVGEEVRFGVSNDSQVQGKLDFSTAVTDQNGKAQVAWSCKGDKTVEQLNAIYARQLCYWVQITASCQTVSSDTYIVVQKESCHRSC